MKKILIKLREPFPPNDAPWRSSAIAFVIVFLILYLFRPFNIGYGMDEWKTFVTILGFSFVSAIIELLYNFARRKFVDTNNWNVGKSIISNLVLLILISVGVFLSGVLMYSWSVNLRIFFIVLNMVILVGIFPIVILTFFNQNRLLKLHLREVTEINNYISKSVNNKSTTVIGDFEIDSNCLIYIESIGNYVTVWYTDGDKIKQKNVRATIKSIEEKANLVKCHRAFIVNLDRVIRTEGNSQGYRLFLDGVEKQIPVSRGYTIAVKNYFK